MNPPKKAEKKMRTIKYTMDETPKDSVLNECPECLVDEEDVVIPVVSQKDKLAEELKFYGYDAETYVGGITIKDRRNPRVSVGMLDAMIANMPVDKIVKQLRRRKQSMGSQPVPVGE